MLRRVLLSACAAGLWLFAFLFAVGAVKLLRHPEPGGSAADWILPAVLAVACLAGAVFATWRLRRPLAAEQLLWPSTQAFVLYLAALPAMVAMPSLAQGSAFLTFCVFSVAAPLASLRRPRWGTTALAALVWGCVLFVALAQTAESASGHSLGEGGMIYLLPMQILLALLAVTGAVRFFHKPRRTA